MDYQYPEFEVVRNADRCIGCRACERQCANEVHYYDADLGKMMCDDSKCVTVRDALPLSDKGFEDYKIRQHLQRKR